MGNLIRFRRKGKAADKGSRALFPPFQGSAPDARPNAFPSDAAPSQPVVRAGEAPDPVFERKKIRKRLVLIFVLGFVFVGGSAAALFGDHGYLDVERQRARLRDLRAETDARQERVEAMRREIDRLSHDPTAVERIAREDLGYVAPGEITLLLPGEDPGEARGLDAKKGSGIVPAVRHTP
jgi:cell division protein FtsB